MSDSSRGDAEDSARPRRVRVVARRQLHQGEAPLRAHEERSRYADAGVAATVPRSGRARGAATRGSTRGARGPLSARRGFRSPRRRVPAWRSAGTRTGTSRRKRSTGPPDSSSGPASMPISTRSRACTGSHRSSISGGKISKVRVSLATAATSRAWNHSGVRTDSPGEGYPYAVLVARPGTPASARCVRARCPRRAPGDPRQLLGLVQVFGGDRVAAGRAGPGPGPGPRRAGPRARRCGRGLSMPLNSAPPCGVMVAAGRPL